MVAGTPGIHAFQTNLFSQGGYAHANEVDPDAPWDTRGWLVGKDLKRQMADYERALNILIITDDLPRNDNGVELDEDTEKAAELLQSAGAKHVHGADAPPLLLHMQSSMRMGEVVDENCEADDIDRLFVGDHSALANGLGGPNPTNTGQALALRTADKIEKLYF